MEYVNFLNKKVFLHDNDQISKWLQDDYYIAGQEGRYEQHLVNIFKMYIQKDFVVIDGGAHLGMHALRLSDLVPEGCVYAFEASPRTYEKLKETIEYNNISNITLLNNALYNENTNAYVIEHIHADQDRVNIGTNHNHKNIKAVSIDSLNLDKLDFIKLDIEGGEYFAILGAENTIKKHKPIITYEYLPNTSRELDPRQLLENWGYAIFQLQTIEGHPHFDYLAVHKDLIQD
jgi:FkbM family methyltransferase